MSEKEHLSLRLVIVKSYYGNFANKDLIVHCRLNSDEKEIPLLTSNKELVLAFKHARREVIFGPFKVNGVYQECIDINSLLNSKKILSFGTITSYPYGEKTLFRYNLTEVELRL